VYRTDAKRNGLSMASRRGLGCLAVLTATSIYEVIAASTSPVVVESISDAGVDESEIIAYRVTIIVLSLILALVLLGFLVSKVRSRYYAELDEEDDELREWCYRLPSGEVGGPHSSAEMRKLYLEGKLTLVKLVWQDAFLPVREHFPETGTEFLVSAQPLTGAAHAEWHRYSFHSKGSGLALPTMAWYYQAPRNGEVQGPFETGKMRHWFALGWFDLSLKVRLGDQDGEFLPVSDYYADEEEAFATNPQKIEKAPPAEVMEMKLKRAISKSSLLASSSAVGLGDVEFTVEPMATKKATNKSQISGASSIVVGKKLSLE